jgi:hypothetical protein
MTTTEPDITAEIHEYMLDISMHSVPPQQGARTLTELRARGVTVRTSCGINWWPRDQTTDDVLCPVCVSMITDEDRQAPPDSQTRVLPYWWLRLTGRSPVW